MTPISRNLYSSQRGTTCRTGLIALRTLATQAASKRAPEAKDHITRALQQSPPPPSSIKRWFRKTFAEPSMLLVSGLGLLYNGSMHSLELWVANKQKGEAVRSRSDIRHIQRNKGDLLRVFPAAAFLAVPFAIPLLPLVFRTAPGFMPSVFVTDEILAKKMQVVQEKRTKLAPNILAMFGRAIEKAVAEQGGQQAQILERRWKQMVANPGRATEGDVISLHSLVRDNANIIMLSMSDLSLLGRFVGLGIPAAAARIRLFAWVDWILKDDALLRQQGIRSLTEYELLEALEERGFINLTNRTLGQLQSMLAQHIKFTKTATDIILQRARAMSARNGVQSAAVKSLPAEDIASMATIILAARALGL